MSSKRIINTEISISNVKAAVETFLRANKVINNSDNVELLTFQTISSGTTVVEWEKMGTVPLQLILYTDQPEENDGFKIIRHTKD